MTANFIEPFDSDESVHSVSAAPVPSVRLGGTEDHIAASADPQAVFTSMADRCVPDLCDGCVVDLRTGAGPLARVVQPPVEAVAGGLLRLANHAATMSDHLVNIEFTLPWSAHGAMTSRPSHDDLQGTAVFVWHRRSPTRGDRVQAHALVEHAVRTVAWQRSEHATSVAATKAEHLGIALQSSRQIGMAIGILMSLHKITSEHALDLLRLASQHHNVKVRDIARTVIETGWLDPDMTFGPPSAPSRRKATNETA